jgi:nucleoside-triphosphatase THEP1
MNDKPALLIVSGDFETGKTRFSQQLAQGLQEAGWDVAGIVSPAVFEDGVKTAIDALDLRSGERHRLAERNQAGSSLDGPATSHWQFSQETLDWCDGVLRSASPCDLLVIDELGPLEFDRGIGLQAGLEAIDEGRYLASVVVVRSALLERVKARWSHAEWIRSVPAEATIPLIEDWIQRLGSLKM